MKGHQLYAVQPLFLKPLFYPGEIIFTRHIIQLNKTLSFRSLNLGTDLNMIHKWVNMDYTLAYWRLNGSKQHLYELYYSIQRNSNGHSYIALLDDQPICQFDVYRILADEIRQFIPANENDCGFHLLMAPNEKPISGLSVAIVQAYLSYYFTFREATQMFAEPDIRNNRSNQILQRAGFSFHHSIEMSYKTANLYSITKQNFNETSTTFL